MIKSIITSTVVASAVLLNISTASAQGGISTDMLNKVQASQKVYGNTKSIKDKQVINISTL